MTNSIIIISCKKQLYKGFESYNQWQFHSPHVRRDDFKTLHGSSLFLFCKSKLQYFSGLIQFIFLNVSVKWDVAGKRVTFLPLIPENPGFFHAVVPPSLKTSNFIAASREGRSRRNVVRKFSVSLAWLWCTSLLSLRDLELSHVVTP